MIKSRNMKRLSTFFILFYMFAAQTCQGQRVNYQQIIFINNLVDPNEYEVETLINLVAYPFVNATNSSLMTDSGLAINYTLIFSIEPDRIINLQSADMDKYSMEYFQNLVKNYTTNSCKGASLKVLNRALKISSKPSIILLAVNKRPKDGDLLREILETMVAKLNPVFVFQIEEDGSISDLPKENRTYIDQYWGTKSTVSVPPCPKVNMTKKDIPRIPEKFQKNNETLIEEFGTIMEVTRDLLYIIAYEGFTQEMNFQKYPYKNKLFPFPKMSFNFSRTFEKRSVVFKTKVIKPSGTYISQWEFLMALYFKERYSLPRYLQVYDWPEFPMSPESDPVIIEDKSKNYTLTGPQITIKVEIRDDQSISSVRGLQKALQLIPEFSWIPYYNIENPNEDERQILPDVIQMIPLLLTEVWVYGHHNILEMIDSWGPPDEDMYAWVYMFPALIPLKATRDGSD